MPEEQTPEETAAALRAEFAALPDEDLATEYSRIRSRGAELSAQADLSAEEMGELSELSARLTPLTAELDARETRANELSAQREAFAALPERTVPVSVPVVPPASSPAAPENSPAPAETPMVPSVAEMGAQSLPVPTRRTHGGHTFAVHLAADGAAAIGATADTVADRAAVSRATAKLFSQYGSAGRGISTKRTVAQFTRDRGEMHTLTGDKHHDAELIHQARSERSLPEGNLLKAWQAQADSMGDAPNALTAAAGWCAPSENLYDLCSLWSSDGMIDLPTVTASRGGFNYTDQPSWAEIVAATSYTQLTEAQVIADTPKVCTELPCPTFTDRRLDVGVTCITASFLQAAGYPEVISTWTDGLLVKHDHEINESVIAQIVTEAGAAVVVPAQGGAGGVGTTPDTSATASILAAVELAAEDMRYGSVMPFSQTFEVILPHWALVQIRADLSRRNGYPNDPFNITNAMIVSWFAVRGIRPQFVYDWQSQSSGLATGPGDVTAPIVPITALPVTVDFLIYPAGAVVLARQDVVTLTNVYDSTNLVQNLYTALFTEEGFAPIFPCGPVRLYTSHLCPSGATAHQVYTSCAAAASA